MYKFDNFSLDSTEKMHSKPQNPKTPKPLSFKKLLTDDATILHKGVSELIIVINKNEDACIFMHIAFFDK